MSIFEMILWWTVVLVGIGGSAICSGLEVGLYTVNRVLVRVHAASHERGQRARMLESQIEDETPTLTALLVWNNIFNYVGTLAITTLIATLGLADIEMILIQIVVLTPVLLIFAESTPKEIFRSNADTLMERFALVIWFLRTALTLVPVVPVILWIAVWASKLVGVDAFGSLTTTRQRVTELLKFGSSQMSETQVSLIDRALELEHATVRSEMIPLRNTVAVRSNWSIEKTKAFVRTHPHSRYPVISTKGQVVGILSSIDLYIAELDSAQTVHDLAHDPTRVAGSLTVSQALGELSSSGGRLGIVVVGGRDVGVVTRKDLIEPLVGELEDW